MKFSIVTITYNSQKTVEETIKSVLSQDYKEVEYIIVDGASTDNTMEIINKYRNYGIKVISEKDNGISDAFNKGIRMASGDVIGIINSDDILMPGALKKVAEKFDEGTECDIVYGNCIRFIKSIDDGYEVKPDYNLAHMKYSFLLLHPSIFIKKTAYEKYGLFKPEFKCAMDYELISRMFSLGAEFRYINESLSAFREGGVSQKKFGKTMKEHKLIAKRNGGNPIQIYGYILKLCLRRYAVFVLQKINLERYIRQTFKHQKYRN